MEKTEEKNNFTWEGFSLPDKKELSVRDIATFIKNDLQLKLFLGVLGISDSLLLYKALQTSIQGDNTVGLMFTGGFIINSIILGSFVGVEIIDNLRKNKLEKREAMEEAAKNDTAEILCIPKVETRFSEYKRKHRIRLKKF